MEFKTDAQKAAYERILAMTRELFGELVQLREDQPGFGVSYGSAWVQTWVSAWGDDDASVTTRSWIVTGAELTQELCHDLLRRNDDVRFGAFGVDSDGDVFFEHTIVASTVTKDQLKASVMSVLRTADQADDEIVGRFGGIRMTDKK